MNQLSKNQIINIAESIRNTVHYKKLKDTTLNYLLEEYLPVSDDFYKALDLLVQENKIFFLVTPGETYVLPVGYPGNS